MRWDSGREEGGMKSCGRVSPGPAGLFSVFACSVPLRDEPIFAVNSSNRVIGSVVYVGPL